LGALALLLALPMTASATYPGSVDGRLAMGSGVNGNFDIYTVLPNGRALRRLTTDPLFDACPAWSADGKRIAWCHGVQAQTGIIDVWTMKANGTGKFQVTDLGGRSFFPDYSPDGSTIVFNSDRDGGLIRGYLMDVDGSNLRRIDVDMWVEYPSFSPDGTSIAFMGALGSNYEIFVADLATDATEQLTDSPGHDGWPSWSPDGSAIAFTTVRDDCSFAPSDLECWVTDQEDEHHDIWLIDPDGGDLRRVTPEFGHFVAWSPDGRYLLISGYALYVVRTDGSGRLELRADGIPRALGGIPDWR
jgi:Tol biopolymer transport system component